MAKSNKTHAEDLKADPIKDKAILHNQSLATTGTVEVTPEKKNVFSSDIDKLMESKAISLQYEKSKTTYIREKVFKYNQEWWDTYREMKTSDDPLDRRLAFLEYNKLQQKVLPTQISSEDGKGIVVNVMKWGDDTPPDNITEQLIQNS